jgi:hypothetical protein
VLLDYVLSHLPGLAHSRQDLAAAEAAALRAPPPWPAPGGALLAIATSSLAAHVRAGGDRPPRRLRLEGLPAAEETRLLAKALTLHDHCLAQGSAACMVGFFRHELRKSRGALGVMLQVLDHLEQARIRLGEDPDPLAPEHAAWTEVMLDHGVSAFHEVPREQADRWAAAREPQ